MTGDPSDRASPQALAQSCHLLEIDGFAVRYGKVEALVCPRLSVRAGSIVTVIGANGAGKSTMLNGIMGSLPGIGHASGVVRYEGTEVQRWEVERRVSAGMSLVPEKRELFASMTVRENLLLGGFRRYRARERQWMESIDEVYALFPRLKERAQQLAGTLSGGERQMLALGRALMSRPRLLMLDEPSLGLAPRVVREIFEVIGRLTAPWRAVAADSDRPDTMSDPALASSRRRLLGAVPELRQKPAPFLRLVIPNPLETLAEVQLGKSPADGDGPARDFNMLPKPTLPVPPEEKK